jgi:hypothetical protein
MANGGLTFLLLPFQSLVGYVLINSVISMNSFRFVHLDNYQRRSGAVRHGAEHERVRRHLEPVRWVAKGG